MDTIEGYLSKQAQKTWPGALVMKRETAGDPVSLYYWIERPNKEAVGLGTDFREARMALEALQKSEEER